MCILDWNSVDTLLVDLCDPSSVTMMTSTTVVHFFTIMLKGHLTSKVLCSITNLVLPQSTSHGKGCLLDYHKEVRGAALLLLGSFYLRAFRSFWVWCQGCLVSPAYSWLLGQSRMLMIKIGCRSNLGFRIYSNTLLWTHCESKLPLSPRGSPVLSICCLLWLKKFPLQVERHHPSGLTRDLLSFLLYQSLVRDSVQMLFSIPQLDAAH